MAKRGPKGKNGPAYSYESQKTTKKPDRELNHGKIAAKNLRTSFVKCKVLLHILAHFAHFAHFAQIAQRQDLVRAALRFRLISHCLQTTWRNTNTIKIGQFAKYVLLCPLTPAVYAVLRRAGEGAVNWIWCLQDGLSCSI